jgi:hypothetical protein
MPDDAPATHEFHDNRFPEKSDDNRHDLPKHDGIRFDMPPAFQARTASDWIASAAVPEPIADICRNGLNLKAMQHLTDVLDFARQHRVDDACLYEAIENASKRAAYRGKNSPNQPLSTLSPGAALSKLRSMLVLALGDDFDLKHPDYERLKHRRSEARARRASQDGTKPSRPAVNAYAVAQGRRDPFAADDSSDSEDPSF